MARTKDQKENIIKNTVEKLRRMKSLVFANYDGLKVKEVDQLRKILREQGIDYLVTKKTLLKRSLKEARLEGIKIDDWRGGLALAFSYDDEIIAAKLMYNFAKEHEALKLIGGIIENKFIDSQTIKKYALLPNKKELLTQLIGLMRYPISGLVSALQGNLRNFVYILKQIKNH